MLDPNISASVADYVCVADLGLFELSLRTSDGKDLVSPSTLLCWKYFCFISDVCVYMYTLHNCVYFILFDRICVNCLVCMVLSTFLCHLVELWFVLFQVDEGGDVRPVS